MPGPRVPTAGYRASRRLGTMEPHGRRASSTRRVGGVGAVVPCPAPASGPRRPRSSRSRCATSTTSAAARTSPATSRRRSPRRDLPGEPLGSLVGRGPGVRHAHDRRRRRRGLGRLGRHAGGPHPHRVAPAPARRRVSSCTTTRPTRPSLAAIGELPELVHQNSSILADELVLVDEYDGEVDQAELGADLAASIGDASSRCS